MKVPATPAFEDQRLKVLEETHLLYSPAEERFDRLTRLAARHFDVPIALISIVGSDKQWFKSAQGLHSSETSREISFCGHAILSDTPLVITDTATDPDFSDNPLVVENPQIRFYAGHPIVHQGMPIGTLCLIDRKPRQFTEEDLDSLKTLAASVATEIGSKPANESERSLIFDSSEETRKQMIDPVTQTWNSSGLDILLSREIELAVSNKNDYALLSVKITIPEKDFELMTAEDGDILLRKVAQDVRSALRPYDLFARTGLTTLVLFCPKCDGDMSELLFDRIRSRIERAPIEVGDQPVTLEVHGGIAHSTVVTTARQLLESAERALEDAIADEKAFIRYIV